MDNVAEVFQVFSQTNQKIAKVVLNGYNIDAGGPLGLHGAMRSFKLLHGDLLPQWETQEMLTLRASSGQTLVVRVAALPAEDEALGLIEFI